MPSKVWLGLKQNKIELSAEGRDVMLRKDQYLDAPHPYTDPRWGDGARDPYFAAENKERKGG